MGLSASHSNRTVLWDLDAGFVYAVLTNDDLASHNSCPGFTQIIDQATLDQKFIDPTSGH
jgi:hypothetical protein